MDILASMHALGHEQVLLSHDPSCGYFGIIAIHDTTLGPALGGTRFWQYASTDEAITDALRLARGMTYKSAVAGINLGGGKSVIVGDNKRVDREALFRAHGRFIETLGGRYITAEDIGTSPADMEYIKLETDHVAGPASACRGDPSPVTAYGVYVGMKAAAKARWGSDSLTGKTVAVQGCGNVATHLCRHLHAEGVKLIVTDIDRDKVRRVVQRDRRHARWHPDAIYDQAADVYAPCALGATINDDTLAAAQGRDHRRRRQQPARRGPPRRPARAAGHPVRAGLRDQRRRRDQRLRRAAPLAARALQEEGRARSTRRCSGSSRSPSGSGSPPTARPTGWRRSGSRRWRGWTGCGWGKAEGGERRAARSR